MGIIEWALIGAIMFGILVFCFRTMRKGIRTLDEHRLQYQEKITAGERQLEEDRKNISAVEQIYLAHAALEDLLRLENNPDGYVVREVGQKLELSTPKGSWHIELLMNERKLRSTHRVLHGKARWQLRGFGHYEYHAELGTLLQHLNELLHSEKWEEDEPEHFTRRIHQHRPRRRGRIA